MPIWLPDPRLQEPRLLIPGLKPLGPVVIDWSNPITDGLKFFMIDWQPPYRDLVSGQVPTTIGGTPEAAIESADGNPCIEFAAEEDLYYSNVRHDIGLGECTLFNIHRKSSSVLNYQIVLALGSSSAYLGLYALWTSSNQIYGTDTTVSGGRNWSDFSSSENLNAFGVSFAGSGGAMDAYLNGIKSTVNNSGMTWSDGDRGVYVNEGQPFDRPMIGKNFCSAIWNRQLSEAEHVKMAHDPYHFLVPA